MPAGFGLRVFGPEPAPADTKARLAALFRTRTQREWCELLSGSDACVAPVLDYTEAPQHPHNRARHTYIDVAGVTQPAPAPRFSRSVSDTPQAPHAAGADADAILQQAGMSAAEIGELRRCGALG